VFLLSGQCELHKGNFGRGSSGVFNLSNKRVARLFSSRAGSSEIGCRRRPVPTAPSSTVRSPADEPASPAAEIDDLSKWDIFSFATVIWYSWYCADPFHGLSVPEVCVAVARGDRPLFEDGDDAPPSLLALVDAMWHQQPSARPSAIAVLAALQSEDLTKEFLHIAFKQDRDNSSLLPHAPKPPSSSNV